MIKGIKKAKKLRVSTRFRLSFRTFCRERPYLKLIAVDHQKTEERYYNLTQSQCWSVPLTWINLFPFICILIPNTSLECDCSQVSAKTFNEQH